MTSTERSPAPPALPRRPAGAIGSGLSRLRLHADGGLRRLRPWRGWRLLERVGAALFVVALPVALIGSTTQALFTSKPLYRYAVAHYDTPQVTGIPRPELDRSMDEIRNYFTDDQSLLRITVTDENGAINPLFTPREVLHMRDVKQLVSRIFRARDLALMILLLYTAMRLLAERRAAWRGIARLTRLSTLGTLVVAVAVGALAATGFDRLFTQFHELSFSNDFWLLDPAQDHLVQMFPEDFWVVSTVLLIGAIIIELLALLAAASWWSQHEGRRGTNPTPDPSTR